MSSYFSLLSDFVVVDECSVQRNRILVSCYFIGGPNERSLPPHYLTKVTVHITNMCIVIYRFWCSRVSVIWCYATSMYNTVCFHSQFMDVLHYFNLHIQANDEYSWPLFSSYPPPSCYQKSTHLKQSKSKSQSCKLMCMYIISKMNGYIFAYA